MDRLVEFLQIRVIVYDWDDPEKIKEALLKFFEGIDLKKEKINIEEVKGKGLVSSELITYTVKINKWRVIKKVLENIKKRIENKEDILRDLEKIVDENGRLYLRFDKDYFVNTGKLMFVDHGEVFHVKITFRAFPRTRENILKVIREFLEDP